VNQTMNSRRDNSNRSLQIKYQNLVLKTPKMMDLHDLSSKQLETSI